MNVDMDRVPAEDSTSSMPTHNNSLPTANIVAFLLKAPQNVAEIIAKKQNLLVGGVILLGVAVAFYAIFGMAMGLFGGWSVAIMAIVKTPLVAVCSLLLCYPSLYVFASVGGSPLSLSQAFLLGASCLAMFGLLLVGLAPVTWLFSVSTESLSFVTLLTLFIWLIAALFVIRYIVKLQAHALFKKTIGIKLWFLVLMVVTLQMVTYMRPMLTAPKDGWRTGQKMFFLSHFGSTFEANK